MVETPISVLGFAIPRYWHLRFHHDAANVWLRHQVKEVFDTQAE
jgi:hypothetical protein